MTSYGTPVFPSWHHMKLMFFPLWDKNSCLLSISPYIPRLHVFFKAQDIPYTQISCSYSGLLISSVADIPTFFSHICFFLFDILRISLRTLVSNSFVSFLKKRGSMVQIVERMDPGAIFSMYEKLKGK